MLGTDLVPALRDAGHHVTVLDLPECDIRRAADLAAAVAGADAIVNCAAYTAVDRAETDAATAAAVNATAVGVLGRLAERTGAYVLHISTDFVFDGTLDRPYRETDAANPLGVYGQTKLAGETALAASGCRHAILRVQWTYGNGGANFVRRLCDRAAADGRLRVVSDQVGAPTWTREVSAALCVLLARRLTGLWHYAADGYASRYDVARFVVNTLGLDVPVTPCGTAEVPAPARRPLNSRFDCSRFDSLVGVPRRSWQAALADFLREHGAALWPARRT
jgi:dTDP-4-dehydrorhamnose reductase